MQMNLFLNCAQKSEDSKWSLWASPESELEIIPCLIHFKNHNLEQKAPRTDFTDCRAHNTEKKGPSLYTNPPRLNETEHKHA